MIFYLVILPAIVGTVFLVTWISGMRTELRRKKEVIKTREREMIGMSKRISALEKDIHDLIEGGLCEQEAVTMKWQKIYEEERRFAEMTQKAYQNSKNRCGKYPALGGLPGLFQPRY